MSGSLSWAFSKVLFISTIAPRKFITPSVMILVLLLGLMDLLLLFFPLSLFDNVLYCIAQSCTILYDTYNYYIALLFYCNNIILLYIAVLYHTDYIILTRMWYHTILLYYVTLLIYYNIIWTIKWYIIT